MLRLAAPRARADGAGRRPAAVASAEDLRAARAEVDATEVTDEVVGYVVAIVRRTRELPSVALGASPRAAVHLLGAAKAAARLAGRAYVTPDDVARMAAPVLRHRLVLTPEAELERATPAGRDPRRARGRPGAAMSARRRHDARPPRGRRSSRSSALAALLVPARARRARWRWRSSSAVAVDARAAKREPQVDASGCPRSCRAASLPAHDHGDPAGGRDGAGAPGRAAGASSSTPREGDGALEATLVARRRGTHTLPALGDPFDRAARARSLGPPGRRGPPSCASSRTSRPRAGSRSPSPAGASATRAPRRAARSASAPSSS